MLTILFRLSDFGLALILLISDRRPVKWTGAPVRFGPYTGAPVICPQAGPQVYLYHSLFNWTSRWRFPGCLSSTSSPLPRSIVSLPALVERSPPGSCRGPGCCLPVGGCCLRVASDGIGRQLFGLLASSLLSHEICGNRRGTRNGTLANSGLFPVEAAIESQFNFLNAHSPLSLINPLCRKMSY